MSPREYSPQEKKEMARVAQVVEAVPMLDTVGDLAALLAQLPADMPLSLDEFVRADPAEKDQVHTVTPRVVAVAEGLGTDDPPLPRQGLQLSLVYVPADGDEAAQATVAARRDLPPYEPMDRAEARIDGGDLRGGLLDLATVLERAALLVGETTPKWLQTGDPAAQSLRVEAERIEYTADRVRTLAENAEVPE